MSVCRRFLKCHWTTIDVLIFETVPRMYATFRHRAVAEVPISIPIPVKNDRNFGIRSRTMANFLQIFEHENIILPSILQRNSSVPFDISLKFS